MAEKLVGRFDCLPVAAIAILLAACAADQPVQSEEKACVYREEYEYYYFGYRAAGWHAGRSNGELIKGYLGDVFIGSTTVWMILAKQEGAIWKT